MNETLDLILEIPFAWRAAIVMFVIWIVYAIAAGGLLKIVMIIPMLFNLIWSLLYRLFNGVAHVLHHNFGRALIGFDQAVTDFFGAVYGFADKVKVTINDKIHTGKLFRGTAFLIAIVMTAWIALPTWVNIEQDTNLITAPYRKYVEIESTILDMIFSDAAVQPVYGRDTK